MMVQFIFRCPVTGLNVQHAVDDGQDVPNNEFEAITTEALALGGLTEALPNGLGGTGNSGPA